MTNKTHVVLSHKHGSQQPGQHDGKGNHCNTGNLVIKVTIITRKSLVPSVTMVAAQTPLNLATEATMVMLVNKISLNSRTLYCKVPINFNVNQTSILSIHFQ